jgi:hypothetical protein
LSTLPRPDTVDFDLQREARRMRITTMMPTEDCNAFEGRIDDDRPDDVSDDQHLQAEQHAAAEVTAQIEIGA